MKQRVNTQTNKLQIKIQPEGLPAIWIDKEAYCERCKPYKECLKFKELSAVEWETINKLILKINMGVSDTCIPLISNS